MKHDGTVYGARVQPDERRILSWSADKTLRLWDIRWPGGNLLEFACALLPDRDLMEVFQHYGVSIADPICAPRWLGKT